MIGLSQGLYLNTGQHKHRINAHARPRVYTHTPNIYALSEIRTHDHGLQASQGSSCLRPLGYRDRLKVGLIISAIKVFIDVRRLNFGKGENMEVTFL
jgi:hypothetical protein